MLTKEEAKAYLRVDSDYEDGIIESLTSSATAICMDMARLTPEEWDAIWNYDMDAEDPEPVVIRGEEYVGRDVVRISRSLHIAVYYALGYLYEHREEADHHALYMTLRCLLSSVREGVL